MRVPAVTIGLMLTLVITGLTGMDRDGEASRVRAQDRTTEPDSVVLELALRAATNARTQGFGPQPVLTIIDYSLPSDCRRLWVLEIETQEVLFHELVAHGKGSGEREAKTFSNVTGSHASALGLFETEDAYEGRHGYSLRLMGLEEGFNDNATERCIVIHGAWYVSDEFANEHNRVGRSWGCPALDPAVSRAIIDVIKNGSLVFAYYPDTMWLTQSTFLPE